MGIFDSTELAPERVDQRNLVVLLLDGSASMQGPPIEALNKAVRQFVETDFRAQPVLGRSGELAIGVFRGESTHWLSLGDHGDGSHPFYFVTGLSNPSPIEPSGATPMCAAILQALEAIDARKDELRRHHPPMSHQHRPVIYLMTDGTSTDTLPVQERAIRRLKEAERAKRVLFVSLGIGEANMDFLASLSVGGRSNALDFKEQPISSLLSFVSRSAEASFRDAGSGHTDYEDLRDPRITYQQISQVAEEFWRTVDHSFLGEDL